MRYPVPLKVYAICLQAKGWFSRVTSHISFHCMKNGTVTFGHTYFTSVIMHFYSNTHVLHESHEYQ